MGFRLGKGKEMGFKVRVIVSRMGVVEIKGKMWLRIEKIGFWRGEKRGKKRKRGRRM